MLSDATLRIVDWLGEVGPRWGLPRQACRVHTVLYLTARPCPPATLAEDLGLDIADVDAALAWLADNRLAEHAPDGWSTGADPWLLMTQTLEARRAAEMADAHAVMADWRRQRADDPVIARQAERLFALVDDIAALEAGARRLSPALTRRLVGVGGRAARLFGRPDRGGDRS
jgi:hypothetical protein